MNKNILEIFKILEPYKDKVPFVRLEGTDAVLCIKKRSDEYDKDNWY